MPAQMRKFWIQFDFQNYPLDKPFMMSIVGYGVTATDLNDALHIIERDVFNNTLPMPLIKKCIEDVVMADLDQNHIVPNINALPFKRAIWYPANYLQQ